MFFYIFQTKKWKKLRIWFVIFFGNCFCFYTIKTDRLPLFFLLEKETYHESKLYWWIFKCAVLNWNELGIIYIYIYIYYIDTYKFLIIRISRIKVMRVLTIGILLHIVLLLLSIFVFPINWSQVRVFRIFVHSGILMHICNSIIIIMHLQTPIY